MGIGSRIKDQALKQGITLRKLAEIAGISYNTIYSITKRDSNRVQGETLQRIADALGVTPTYLIGYDDKIVKPEQYTPEELAEIKSGAWEAYQQHVEETTSSRAYLNAAFSKLNTKGQQVAVERIEELTQMPQYTVRFESLTPDERHLAETGQWQKLAELQFSRQSVPDSDPSDTP